MPRLVDSSCPQRRLPYEDDVIGRVDAWLERAVIGLNLCPFAKAVHVKGLVHYRVSAARHEAQVLADLRDELLALEAIPASERDTTLLVMPQGFADFLDFNDLLDPADELIASLGLEGVIQIASFHPQYRFAGVAEDDITNFTNRAPYPTLHLLREDSIARAVDAMAQPEAIYETNMRTLQALGAEGWQRLDVGPPGERDR